MTPKNSQEIALLLADAPTRLTATPFGNPTHLPRERDVYSPFHHALQSIRADAPNTTLDVDLLRKPLAPTIVHAITQTAQDRRFG